ncbi:MAG: hypothetical protein FWF12_10395 [Betaproteobacteria bacterium]|nr:hypothetical protein [Betaproteobacteria bacterium]
MTTDNMAHDPLEFVRNMWSRMGFALPGMVTPTLDVDELEKRIGDMKAVEGWLKMNLSMLQMAIQGLDMQRAAIAAVHAMSKPMQPAQDDGPKGEEAVGNNPFLWPWNMMAGNAQAENKETPAADATVADSETKSRGKRKAAANDK